MFIVLGLSYVINRRGRYVPSAVLTVLALAAAILAGSHLAFMGLMLPYFGTNDVFLLAYLVLPVLLSAALLPAKVWVAMFFLLLGLVILAPLFHQNLSAQEILYGPVLYLIAVGGVLLFLVHLLRALQRSRYRQLEEREQRFRILFEQSPDAISLVSAAGIIEAVNRAGLALFGYEPGELDGLPARVVYANPDNRPALMARVEREGGLTDEPVRMRRKDGSLVECLATIALCRDAAGGTIGFQTVLRDVTERLRIQEELRLKGELLDLARDAIMLVDPGGEIVYANEAAVLLTGYPLVQLIGKNIRALETPAEAEQVPTRIGELLRDGHSEFDAEWVRSDGHKVDVEVRSRTVDSRGRTLFLSVVRDVSRRKADEAEIRLRSEVLDAAQDAVFLQDLKGGIIYANASAAQMLGYTPDELLAMEARELEAPEDAFKFRDRMSELFVRQSLAYETDYVSSNGIVVPVEVRARLIESAGDIYVVSIARDVRERKKAAEVLKAEHDRAQQYLDIAAVMFVVLDVAGNVTLVNRKGAELLGISEQELVGRNWFDTCIPEEQRNRVSSVFKSLMSGHLEQPFEYFENDVLTAAGGVRNIAWHNTLLRGSDGRPAGLLSSGEDITGRRAAERALRESEQRYRTLFEQSMDAIYINAADGRSIEANQAWLNLFGYTRDELKSLGAADVYAIPADRASFLDRIERTGFVFDEVMMKRKDGTIFDCQRSVVARRDDSGTIVQFQGVMRDVTEIRNAERLLRESEEKYRSLFERSIDAVCLVALDGTLLEANQAYLDLYGYNATAIGTVNVREHYVDPADRDAFLRLLERDGVVVDSEVRALKTDGTMMDCVRTSVARRDEAGRIVTIQTVTRDVTGDRQRRAALADELARRRILLEQSRDGIVVLDQNGKVVEANRSFAQMLGYSPEEVTELHVWDWEFLYSLDRLKEMLRTVDEAGDHFETQHRRKDGTVFDVEISTNAAVFAGQKLIFCVCRDTSARKRAARELLENEQKYRTLFEQSMDAVAVYSVDGTLLDANPAHLRLFGLSPADIGTSNARSLYVEPSERDEFLRLLALDGVVMDQEVRLMRNDGTVMDCVRSAVARYDEDGRLIAAQTVTRDITEHKKAEQALRESEERFRALVDHTGLGMTISRTDSAIIECNEAFAEMLGYTKDEVLQRRVTDIYAERSDRERVLAQALEGRVRARRSRRVQAQGRDFAVRQHDFRVDSDGRTHGGSVSISRHH